MNGTRNITLFTIARIVTAGMLLWAQWKHPVGYYTLVRFSACLTCAYGAYIARNMRKTGWVWAMAIVALLFNPIAPILLKRGEWLNIDAITATFLLASIGFLRTTNRPNACTNELNNDEYQSHVNQILSGAAWILFWCWITVAMIGNPLDERALIERGVTTHGRIVATSEDVDDDDRWHYRLYYTYQLADGRQFQGKTLEGPGSLPDDLREADRSSDEISELRQPHAVDVEYLPENPRISRIKGTGSPNMIDWWWRKFGLGTVLLAMFVSPGVYAMWTGIRQLRGLPPLPAID